MRLIFSLALTIAAVALAHATPSDPGLTVTVDTVYTTDVLWSLADSPVAVKGVVTIGDGGALTVDPGVVVSMAPGAAIINRCSLRVLGTEQLPVSVVLCVFVKRFCGRMRPYAYC